MMHHYKRAIQDIFNNRFLNAVTVVTIALSILIVSAFYLFFINASDIMNSWKAGIRIMAYVRTDTAEDRIDTLTRQIETIPGVRDVRFVSKFEALEYLKKTMKHQSSLLEDLAKNPLPDAFEVRMTATVDHMAQIESLAARLESLDAIQDVEYGEQWLGRFSSVFNLFTFVGYAIGCVFFMAAVFIVANTIRLVLYSRREEVEIMRLVGATDGFIKAPFYLEGLIQGALGGIFGLMALFVTFLLVSSNMEQGFSANWLQIRFLPARALALILLVSMAVGWLGSYLSLRQFLKT